MIFFSYRSLNVKTPTSATKRPQPEPQLPTAMVTNPITTHRQQLELKRPKTCQRCWCVLGQMYVFFFISFTLLMKLLDIYLNHNDRIGWGNGEQRGEPKTRDPRDVVINVSWAIGMFFYLLFFYLHFFFHSNDDGWPLFIITEFTEAESISPQNDARRATILALPPQIEANILPADVADAIQSLWLDAYNGKPPLEFFFSLKCLFTHFYQYWWNDDFKPQPQPPTAMVTFIGLGCIMYTLVLEHSFWSREQDFRLHFYLLKTMGWLGWQVCDEPMMRGPAVEKRLFPFCTFCTFLFSMSEKAAKRPKKGIRDLSTYWCCV